jgi:type I restriction enzyme S subunit
MMKHYDSYKDSGIEWIGEIPSHWSEVKPQFLFSPVNRTPLDDDDIVTCFRDGIVTLRKNRREEGFTNSIKEIGYQRILVEDLVVHEMDGFEGSIGVSDSNGKSTPVYTVIPPSEKHNNYYWMYLLREMSNTRFIQSLSKSIRERTTEFRWNTWKNQLFPLPPLSEQEQIVSYLDDKTTKIDELIQKKLRKINLLKEYRTSLINTVVTKGLNPDVPMKDSGIEWIGEIPSHWETSKYKTLGNRFTQNIDVSEFQNREVIHYSIPNVQENGIGILESGEDIDSSKILLKGGELIISKLNPRKSCVSIVEPNNDFLIVGSGEFVTLVPDKGNIKFLFYFVKSQQFTEYLDSCVESVTRSHQRVNPYIIYSSLIPLPPISEQEHIVSYLDEKTSQIDKTIDIEKKKIELLKEYRQSLISNVVTGKIKVTE